MRVSDLMHPTVNTILRDQLLPEAVETMADLHVSALAVVDPHDRIIGVISTADILTAQAEYATGLNNWEKRMVGDVMSAPALTIPPDATVGEAVQRLLYTDVHRLFVVEHEIPVGVISQTDLVRTLASHRLNV